MKLIAYTRQEDGLLAVIVPARNTHALMPNGDIVEAPEELTDGQILAAAVRDIPKGAIDPKVIDITEAEWSALTDDKTYFGSYKVVAGKITPNMPSARDIHRNLIRSLRAPKLASLDVAFLRVLETTDRGAPAVQAIVQQKQALRDLTKHPAIEAAQTIEELRAFVPKELA